MKRSSRKFLGVVDRNCADNIISDEIDINFLSKLKEITLQHYMNRPRSMLCRKLERYYPTPDDENFHYNFLPYCFRHIGFQPSTWQRIILRLRD